MPHPSEAILLAFADDELGPAERDQVSAHVHGCGVCRHALRDVREAMAAVRVEAAIIDAAEPASWRDAAQPPLRPARPAAPRHRSLAALDGAPPAGRAARGARPGDQTGRERRGSATADAPARDAAGGRFAVWGMGRARVVALRWAAILAVFVAGGATAMLAPRWGALLGGDDASDDRATSSAPASAAGAAPAALRTAAAVSVLPRDGRATVVLQPGALAPAMAGDASPAAAPAMLVVKVSERADVQVTVTSPLASAEAPRFRTADGRLDVALAGNESQVEVEVPATLGEAHIVLGTRTLVTVRAGVVAPQQASTTGVPLGVER